VIICLSSSRLKRSSVWAEGFVALLLCCSPGLVCAAQIPQTTQAPATPKAEQQTEKAPQQTDSPALVPPALPASPTNASPNVLPPVQQTTQQQSPPLETPPSPELKKQTTPLGTGAAPDMGARGVAASRPAGAAIAPAKQKRTFSFAVRTALVVGGAVALGVVTGLTLGTSGRPH
jgi:hypothetical protein